MINPYIIWLILTFDSRKNTLTSFFYPKIWWLVLLRWIFRSTIVGKIKENGGFRESWDCETIRAIFVGIFMG